MQMYFSFKLYKILLSLIKIVNSRFPYWDVFILKKQLGIEEWRGSRRYKPHCLLADPPLGDSHYTWADKAEWRREERAETRKVQRWDERAGGLMQQPNKSHWDIFFSLLLSLILISPWSNSLSRSTEFLSFCWRLSLQSSCFLYVALSLLVSASGCIFSAHILCSISLSCSILHF